MEYNTLYGQLLGIRKQYLRILSIVVLLTTVITLHCLDFFEQERRFVILKPERHVYSGVKTKVGMQSVQQQSGNHSDSQLLDHGKKNDSLTYHGMNLMDLPPYRFAAQYKNPCWREKGTMRMRCLPYFFLIGVMKCGSSMLWEYIKYHPDFALPVFRKESQWFAKKRFKTRNGDLNSFINMFQSAANRIEKENGTSLITGEGSPSNLYNNSHWRYLPGNENLEEPKYVILDYIHHFLPKAKIIIIFRDPVERLYSEYYHRFDEERGEGWSKPSPEKFHAVVLKGVKLYKECLKIRTIRACVYDERIYDPLNLAIQLGFYHVYWEELTRLFPRDQILPLQHEELADYDALMDKVFKFLGMRPVGELKRLKGTLDLLAKKRFNARHLRHVAEGDMLNDTRRILVEFYRPHNEKMSQLMNDEAFLYL